MTSDVTVTGDNHCNHGRSKGFWLGEGQTTNHMQWRHQKFSKEEIFVAQRYRRMEDLKPWPIVGN